MYLRVSMNRFVSFKKTSQLFMALSVAVLVSCTQQPASLEVKHSPARYKSDYSPTRDVNLITPYKINVQKGQTLYEVAREHEVPIRDLIEINSLKPPYKLMVGQQLKLPKPTYHLVRAGDTAYDVARGYDIDVAQLVRANNIEHPYVIKLGQRLKIPGKQSNIASTETAIDENETQSSLAYSRDVQAKPLSSSSSQTASNTRVSGLPMPVQRPNGSTSATRVASSNNKTFTPSKRQPHFAWPLKGNVISSFGPKQGGLQNDGINISASEGSSIQSAEEGVVVYAGNELKGYGNLLLIKHNGGYLSAYAHAKDLLVGKGDAVAKGQKIATVGSTGHVDKPQLHFSIRKGRTAVNPTTYLSRSFSSR